MGISLVSRANTPLASTGASVASPAQAHAAGNLLVALIKHAGPTVSSVTNTAGDTWTKSSLSPFVDVSSAMYLSIWFVFVTAGNAADVVTANFAGSYAGNTLTVYEVTSTVLPFVFPHAASSGSADTNGPIKTGTITVSSNAFIAAIYANDMATPMGAGTPYTQFQADDHGAVCDSYRIVNSVNDIASATLMSADAVNWAILAARFYDSSVGVAAGLPDGQQVHLMLDGVHWTDVSSDSRAAGNYDLDYGMPDGKPTSRCAQSGAFTFWLNNSTTNSGGKQGYYSPRHANCRAGFAQNIPCRIVFSLGGTSYYKWVGRLKTIDPLPGKYDAQYVVCTALDYMDDLARANLTGIPTQASKKFDAMLTTLIAAMQTQPTATSFDSGTSTFPWGMVSGGDGVINGLQEAQRLAMSEFGYIYIKGDTVAGGILRAENRTKRATITSPIATLNDTMGQNPGGATPLTVTASIDDVINAVQVTVHPRLTVGSLGSEIVLYSLLTATSGSPTLLAAGQVLTINGSYRDPSAPTSVGSGQIAGTGMLNPVATTDYTANSAANGSGTNLTASTTVVASFGSTGVTLVVTNTSGTPAYLTKLQCRGIGLFDYGPTLAIAQNATSQGLFGTNTLQVDCPYEADPLNGQATAAGIVSNWKNPFGYAQSVSFIARGALQTSAYAVEIGDRVTIAETVTGVNADFFVNGIHLHVIQGGIVSCTWRLAPALYGPAPFQLGTLGFDKLDSTAILG